MSAWRVRHTVLAAVATATVALPLHALFTSGWQLSAGAAISLVALTGLLARRVGLSSVPTVALQLLASTGLLTIRFARDTLWYLAPTPSTAGRFADLAAAAQEAVITQQAPVATDAGVAFGLTALIALTAIAVDALGAGLGRPALAGLPLAIAYLAAAANTAAGLNWALAALAAAAWLAMLAAEGVERAAGWSRWSMRLDRPSRDESSDAASESYSASAGRIAAAALVACIGIPALLPSLPTRFLFAGLGEGGTGNGQGLVSLSSTLDVGRDLTRTDPRTVLLYQGSTGGEPLRVNVLVDFHSGLWHPRPDEPIAVQSGEIDEDDQRISVTASRLAAPQIAVPTRTTRIDGGPVWGTDSSGVVRVPSAATSYTVRFRPMAASENDLEAVVRDGSILDPTMGVGLSVDSPMLPALRTALAEAGVNPDDKPITIARKIQSFLRGPSFRYDLDLEEPGEGADPVTAFLSERRGYCVQFATTMVMLARSQGIPARLALGFLPGSRQGESFVVTTSDAHAWPELFFAGIGWLRFEPTPGQQATNPPSYSLSRSTPTATASSGQSTAVNPRPSTRPDVDPITPVTGGATQPSLLQRVLQIPHLGTALTALALLAAGAGLGPAGAALGRRRQLRRAQSAPDRVETEWEVLLDDLRDLGVDPSAGATPRDFGRQLLTHTHLSDSTRPHVAVIVDTVEAARYRQERPNPAVLRQASLAVVHEIRGRRSLTTRARARFLPSRGVAFWRSLARLPRRGTSDR